VTVRAYVGIGSNIEPEQNVRSAVRALRACFGMLTISPVYRSPAEGFPGDDFYNLVVGLDTGEPAARVEATLRRIERDHGRVRYGNGMHSRTLDLDLLVYGGRVLRDDVTRYDFVLKPLVDLAPNLRHPERNLSVKELWERFDGKRTPLTPVALQPPL